MLFYYSISLLFIICNDNILLAVNGKWTISLYYIFIYSYDIPAGCLNTESGEVEDGKVLRVVDVDGLEITVTVSNMDGDGYLAIPDVYAGKNTYIHYH